MCERIRQVDPRRGWGFTLVELLVVIAIIALLVSLITPSLQQAKYLTRRAICASQIRQQYLAQETYASAHLGKFPRHTDHSPEYLRSSSHDPNDNVIDNMKRARLLKSEATICPLCEVYGSRYADPKVPGDYGGIDEGYPNALGAYMWLANYKHWNGVLLQDGEKPFATQMAECDDSVAFITHRISLLDPWIRDVAHRGQGLYSRSGPVDFEADTTTVDQPVGYGDGSVKIHARDEIQWRFTIPGVGDYWY